MCQAIHIIKTLNVIGVIVAVTIIAALAGIAVVAVAAAASLLVQSASATTDVTMTNNTTTSVGGGGEQEAASSTTTTTNTNNVSNAVLGPLFMIVEFKTASVNPINETYIEISTVNNVTIMPPNATATTTINATETVNATLNIQPNGLGFDYGESLIVTEGDDDGTAAQQEENATTTFIDISRMNPDGTGSGTGVVFFSTNSTGQLAFLDNMVGISQSEFSPEGGIIRTWEWKGDGTVPFETGGGTPEGPPLMNTTTMTNGTAGTNITRATQEEQQRQATSTIPAPLL
jgi:hypothetical protein